MPSAQIIEMDQERDRKTCLALDLKVTGANRELAQWIADHRGKYSAEVIAGWLGCSDFRVKNLRQWAEGGFRGAPTYNEKRKAREQEDRRRVSDPALESLDNSENDGHDDAEESGGIAPPEQIEDNILYTIARVNEHARMFRSLVRASALDREAASRVHTAIERMIGKWRLIQSTLERKE